MYLQEVSFFPFASASCVKTLHKLMLATQSYITLLLVGNGNITYLKTLCLLNYLNGTCNYPTTMVPSPGNS